MEVKILSACLIVLILQLNSFFQGCAILECLNNRVRNEMQKLKAENVGVQKQIDTYELTPMAFGSKVRA